MEPVLIKAKVKRGNAHFSLLLNWESKYKLNKGISCANEIPADAAFRMDDDFPNDTTVGDYLGTRGHMVVSEKARDFLAARLPASTVEFLPIRILDHQGAPLPGPYSLINVLRHVDCLDRDASGCTMSDLDPDDVISVDQLVLDPARLPDDVELFKVAHMPGLVIAARQLVDDMKAAGIEGVDCSELEDYFG
jgi:hypothetical protein